jgi:type II secretory pathway pseudopilin PulG
MRLTPRAGVPAPTTRRRQRGLGLLEVLLFIAIVGGLATVGYLEWRERSALQSSRQERASLSQADTAVITFATVMRRLPCPDTDRDGLEDCGAGAQKGWLPSASLKLAGADAGVGVAQLRYLVQRGATAYDLAVLGDDWRPLEYDDGATTFAAMRDTVGNGGSYQANILTLPDLCQRVGQGVAATFGAGMAHVTSSPLRPVAYALVHPGLEDTDGDGSLFDGVNGAAGNTVEDPDRSPLLSSYDDVVRERSLASLQSAFHCQPLAQSIDTVALGLDVVNQVDEMREDNIDAAERAVIFAALGAAITAVELTASVVEAASDTGNAVAEATLCGATLGLAVNACAAFPQHIASAVLAGVSTAANIATIALNVTAAIMAGNALVLADNSRPPASVSCPVPDVSAALAASLDEWNKAKAEVTRLEGEVAAKQIELANANIAKTAAITALESSVLTDGFIGGISSTLDGTVDQLIAGSNTWNQEALDYAAAQATRTLYQTEYDSWSDIVVRYNDMLTNRTMLIPQVEAEIAALDILIAAETDQTAKEALQLQRSNKQGELALLNDVTTLTSERDNAIVKRDQAYVNLQAAIAAEANALAVLNGARGSYQTAYANLANGSWGPYLIQRTPPLGSLTACTPQTFPSTCPGASIQTRPFVLAAMQDLFGSGGDTGSTQPHADSKYMRPLTIQRQLDGLNAQLTAAREMEVDTKKRYDDLKAQADNPPACNLTGTGVTPWSPTTAADLLINVDVKGGTR